MLGRSNYLFGTIIAPDEQWKGPVVMFPSFQDPVPKPNLRAPVPTVPDKMAKAPGVAGDSWFPRETQQSEIGVVMFSQSDGSTEVHRSLFSQVD